MKTTPGKAYYSEWNKYKAQKLRDLIDDGRLPNGDVDDRDIRTIKPDELKGYSACHFFAGIGGWPLALQIAGWPPSRPVWTGSPPCQGYSTVGAKKGREDERHLWPAWFRLARECAPPVLFGEQVANAITYGWLDEVFHDMEGEAYSCAAAVLRACAVNKDHERKRLFFVAQRKGCDDYREPREIQGSYELQKNKRQKMGDAEFGYPASLGEGFIVCRDGYKRKAFPPITMFSHGISDQLAIEEALGDAIVPQVAAEFISAFLDCTTSPSRIKPHVYRRTA